MQIQKLIENVGSASTLISAMGCASCFPAAAAFGSTIGLGFLSAYEGVLINTLLPVFATLSLIIQLYTGWVTRNVLLTLLGVAGPLMILATLYLFWTDNWSTYMFYAGLVLMFCVSVWQWLMPVCTRFNQNKTSNNIQS